MSSWHKLTSEENHRTWDLFYEEFKFRPSIDSKDWPSIETDLPQLKLDIMECYREGYDQGCFNILEELAKEIFKNITEVNEHMFALDWQHPGYEFDPRKEFPIDPKFKEWPVPVLPNGDYYIFLTQDFQNLWFGHPWEETITLIGKDIVTAGRERMAEFNRMKFWLMNN